MFAHINVTQLNGRTQEMGGFSMASMVVAPKHCLVYSEYRPINIDHVLACKLNIHTGAVLLLLRCFSRLLNDPVMYEITIITEVGWVY